MNEEDFRTAINFLGNQIERLIDINMMVLGALDPEAMKTVDRVHNELGMLMTEEWEAEIGNSAGDGTA